MRSREHPTPVRQRHLGRGVPSTRSRADAATGLGRKFSAPVGSDPRDERHAEVVRQLHPRTGGFV